MGSDFPAPIVVAQHLDPRVESSLATILAKRTPLAVVSVSDREKLLPGTVYVVPANRHVEILDGHVSVHSDGAPRPKPSVDLLFGTAAQVYGERLIAVVLTGMGNDGAFGVRAVKNRGGTVIIEDPRTATFPSMPASLPSSMVDIVAPVDRIGGELELLLVESTELTDDTRLLTAVLDRVNATCGIDFSHYKMPTIKRRLARQLKSSGMSSLADYVKYIERTPGESEKLAGAFLINVTEFFRDPDLFDWLRRNAITELVEQARSTGRELRLWSAGCATGEEAYSLAILVAEVLGDELRSFDVRIFATDLDEAAISFARHGVYRADALVNLSPELVNRYFTGVGEDFVVSKTIRDLMVFGQHDLAQRAPFPRIDLVLCRNVMIYFSKELQIRTLQLFAFSLRNGGILALGKAESNNPLPKNFEAIESNLRVFRRFGDRVLIPSAPTVSAARPSAREERTLGRLPFKVARDTRQIEHEEVGAFLMDSIVGFVSLDDRYGIAIINAAARRMLSVHGTAIGEDLVHLIADDSATQLRAIIDAARRSEEPQLGGEEITIAREDEDEERCLSIACYPKRSPGRGGVALLILDVTEHVRERKRTEALALTQAADVERMKSRELESRRRQHDLLEANRQLVDANVELRARTDALLIGAEEAIAATEEIETLNEEMQATNEELETLNEESQATIEELNTTNDELEARTVELQDLLVGRELDRQSALDTASAFQAIVDSFSQPMAVVDPNGDVVAANKPFRDLDELESTNSVRAGGKREKAEDMKTIVKRIAQGETVEFFRRVTNADGSTTVYRGTASSLGGSAPSGAFVILNKAE